ncbi:c-type cytochrome biogenesis protein CcsB [Thermogemmatispora sp.]|uniref:c-type cytochrome biogenesis protein CcsB n=1 Tax=Thermogemmatispora sp. TaxID=1968838 RepID=UPI001D3AAFBF|nr:c-type cytochrome biogenesis protein CcsB [Thermogemmatispora sp.]MBX5448544.1 c-type cytochrome biogenesis protein CcsB [Thermogemmatispora sp.]
MQLFMVTASSETAALQGLATLSKYLFTTGLCMIGVMTVAYLWYTIGTARLAKQVTRQVQRQRSKDQRVAQSAKQTAAVAAVDGEGSVATLVRQEVILNEQPDGEKPIPLSRSLIAVGRIGTTVGWFAALTLVLSQGLRTIVTGHAPWSNLFEFSVSFTAALLLCYLLFEARFHERVRAWGLYVCLLSVVTLVIAIYVGTTYNLITGSSQLIPALQDQPILTLHVSMAIFAYALFSVAFGTGLIILLQGGSGQRIAWLPSAEAADELGYKAVIIGFPLLALNLILGAYWANYAWGHFWSWDPKETSALITWLIYAVYLHARGIRGWRGKRIGWLLVIGFAATLFTYYGVSFLVPSLHSYAK